MSISIILIYSTTTTLCLSMKAMQLNKDWHINFINF